MKQEAKGIKRIREMMERSSNFHYINGLSVVFAGLAAALGIHIPNTSYSVTEDGKNAFKLHLDASERLFK